MKDMFEVLKCPETKMNSRECKEWKKTHKNCAGCPSEEACKESIMRYGQYVTKVVNEEEGLELKWMEDK